MPTLRSGRSVKNIAEDVGLKETRPPVVVLDDEYHRVTLYRYEPDISGTQIIHKPVSEFTHPSDEEGGCSSEIMMDFGLRVAELLEELEVLKKERGKSLMAIVWEKEFDLVEIENKRRIAADKIFEEPKWLLRADACKDLIECGYIDWDVAECLESEDYEWIGVEPRDALLPEDWGLAPKELK